jgi:hypothetical protein
MAKLMTSTFYSLLPLADLTASSPAATLEKKQEPEPAPQSVLQHSDNRDRLPTPPTLHYNIQIHLPATKDLEVFNAIFKSLREHLLD